MRAARLLRLRPTLLTTIIGLVLLTALAIGGGAVVLTLSVTRTLIDQARTGAVNAAREETRDLFDSAPRIVGELTAVARRGALPMEDRARFAVLFAERLRAAPLLHAIGYGDVAGWYVGATRSSAGEVVEYIADPAINDGRPEEAAVTADGVRSAPREMEGGRYFVVTRPWFIQGVKTAGAGWSPFYTFVTGGTGITALERFVPPGAAEPRGVFHADLRVEGMERFLATLRIGKRGSVFLVDHDGRRVVDPEGLDISRTGPALDAAAARRADETLSHPGLVRVGSRFYEVVFEPVRTEGGDIGLSIGVVVDLRDISRGAYWHAIVAAGVALITLLLATWAARRLSSRIAEPIIAIARDLGQVGAFSISREPSPQSFVREVSELGASVDRMKASLRSFAHYVPTDLVRRLLAQGQEAELGGERRRLTIYFSDIENFTTIAESMNPDRLVEAVGHYLELMTGTITRHGGTVDKFIGDGVMAFFNAPEELLGHPRQACLAALDGQRLLAERGSVPGEPVFRTRIGLGLGEVLVGNIGTPERFAYTLLGDEVNLASRLEGLNKLYGTLIIGTGAVMDEAGDNFEWRRLDRVAVKGRTQGTLICELIGEKGEALATILKARDAYERGLDAYFTADFVGSSRVDLQACKLEYSIVSPK